MTVLQLLTDSYQLLMGEDDPSANQLATGLRALNALLNEWSTQRWGIYTVTNEGLSLTAGTGSYTIGPTGDFVTARPIRVLDAFVRDSNNVDYKVEIVDRAWANERPLKSTQSVPFEIYYEPTFTNGTFTLYPVPDIVYTLYLYSEKALTQYTALANDLNLPPEYETALKFNVCIDWANQLGVDPSGVIASRAAQTLRQLKTLHSVPVPKVQTAPFETGRNLLPNIYSGGY